MGFEGTNNQLNHIKCIPVHCNQLLGGKKSMNVLNQGSFGMTSQFQHLPPDEFQLVHKYVGVGSRRVGPSRRVGAGSSRRVDVG